MTHSGPSTRPLFPITLLTISLLTMSATFSAATEWELANGPYGGDVVSLAADGSGSIYAARSDDVFRSDDGGDSWINISNGEIPATIRCLFATPAGDLYAGTSIRGVFWSFDGGGTWENNQITHDPHGGLGATITAVGVNGSGVIFAGSFRSLDDGITWLDLGFYGETFTLDAAGDVYAGSNAGVRFSADDGATWTELNAGMETETVEALALNSNGHIFAGTRDSGVFLSIDGGASWSPVSSGLPSLRVSAIAVDSADRVYLTLADGGLYLSNDSGASWNAIETGLESRAIQCLVIGIADEAYAGSEFNGVFRSDDHGADWTSRAKAVMGLPRLEDLAVAPQTGDIFLAADGGGIYRSTNGGIDWEEASAGLSTTRAHAVAVDSSDRIYAGSEDGVYASADAGATWFAANAGHEGNAVHGLLVDGDDNVIAVLTAADGSFVFSVIRSTDGGASWQEILSDQDGTFSTTADAWAIDSEARIYIGGMSPLTDGVIFRSETDGQTWEEITFPAGLGITGITVDASDHVYTALGTNDLFESTDHGGSWTQIPNGGWPTGTIGLLHVVAGDGEGALLVSARNSGIWRSSDGGASWISYDEGLPIAGFPNVTFLETAGGVSFAGTLKGGLFRREGTTTSVESGDGVAKPAALVVAPNPFNPFTTIRYELDEDLPVRVTIHDVAGHLVRTLERAPRMAAGKHTLVWDGRNDSRGDAPSGVYFVRVETGGSRIVGKLVLVR